MEIFDLMSKLHKSTNSALIDNQLGYIPVVYELIRKNNGLSVSTLEHSSTKSYMLSSNFQTSPFVPLPYDGGSIMIAW